ncbi:Ig-like domain-containing protein [Salinicoccus albus]|uniref:Ig-like domain-containing protein n=1 Tax=Salinicoccus albus TaxID=418756 RepID=UPI0012EA02D6|nr:Ig-like domain-containing protein [Salinicoccus albus]
MDITGDPSSGYEVSGQIDGSDSIGIYNSDGELVAEGTADEAGSFSIEFDADQVVPGETLKIISEDEDGNTGSEFQVTVPYEKSEEIDEEAAASDGGGNGNLPDTGVPAAPLGIAAAGLLILGSILTFFRRSPK